MTQSQTKNYNHVFDELQDYMFTNEFIYKYCNYNKKNDVNNELKKKNSEIKHNAYKNNNTINNTNNDYIFPVEKDKLFWCFYIIKNGVENYEFNKTISFKTEKDFKFVSAEKIKEFKDTFKSLKLKLNELQDELINQQCITFKGLVALCYIYKINILYVKNKTYYEIITNEDGNINVILERKENNITQISMPVNITDEMIKRYKNNYWKIENFNNPLKSISAYTLSELQEIYKKLNIEIENKKKLTKKELYENIMKYF